MRFISAISEYVCMAEYHKKFNALATDVAVLKQVQFGCRRYAISIEPIFWNLLEDISHEEKIRLNALVKSIISDPVGPNNMTARIRIFCIRFLMAQLSEIKKPFRHINIDQIIESCPTPCIAFSDSGVITGCNHSLFNITGLNAACTAGIKFSHLFKLLKADKDNKLVEFNNYNSMLPSVFTGYISFEQPGIVLVKQVSICPVRTTINRRAYIAFIKS